MFSDRDDNQRHPDQDRKPRNGVQQPRRVVLLIEDNDLDRDIYGSLLWYNGFDVLHAADGESGVARAAEERPDLILIDMRLPGDLDGVDVLHRIRAEGLSVPMIALTAIAREEIGDAADEFTVYLEKPIPPVDVVRAVHRLIRAHR